MQNLGLFHLLSLPIDPVWIIIMVALSNLEWCSLLFIKHHLLSIVN